MNSILSGVVSIETWNPCTADADYEFDYIDIASVDRDSKRINPSKVIAANAPSRARQIVKKNDVLVSTVRPNLNAVALVPDELDDAIASTGFCVLRCQPSKLDHRYLFHWVRTPMFVTGMVRQATGASYPAVSDRIVKESKIPSPPLSEQKRVADILDKADTIRRKRQEAISALDAFVRAQFLECAGDPTTNPKRFPSKSLDQVFNIRTGRIDANAAVQGGEYPFFTCSRDTFAIDVYAFDCEALILSGNNAAAEYSVKHAKGKFNAYQRTYVLCLKSSTDSYGFFKQVLEYKLNELKHGSRGTNTKYLTMEFFRRFTLPIPPSSVQRHFDDILVNFNRVRSQFISARKEADELFKSLVYRAFRGEL